MPINAVIDIQEQYYASPDIIEPVSLQEAKDYCKIDTTEDDTIIERLIVSARILLERYCGLSFIPKTVTAILQNECSQIELPYGPVIGDINPDLVLAIDGTVFNSSLIQIVGNQFRYVYGPITPYVQITYNTGYNDGELPQPLRFGIMAQVFFNYHNRGETPGYKNYTSSYVCDAAKEFCNRFRRVTELAL